MTTSGLKGFICCVVVVGSVLAGTQPNHTAYRFIHAVESATEASRTAPTLPDVIPLQTRIQAYIAGERQKQHVAHVSVYGSALEERQAFAIGGMHVFDPGSLLKVPILMAYLKAAEHDPVLLDHAVFYTSETTPPVVPDQLPSRLVARRWYTTRQLLTAMIVDSDNAAKDLLLHHMDATTLFEVYTALPEVYTGVGISDGQARTHHVLSAPAYATFFRHLYDATFLTPAASEYALTLLSRAHFVDGLVHGAPAGMAVAHKYGERGMYSPDGTRIGVELHDCGILYFPHRPFLLCIMTAGQDVSHLEGVIQTITHLVSTFVSS